MVSSSGDVFSEVLVKRKTTPGNIVVRVICGIVTFLIAALFWCWVFLLHFRAFFIFALVILVLRYLSVVLEYFLIRFQKVEYEYIFTAGDLDFDQLSGDFRVVRESSV